MIFRHLKYRNGKESVFLDVDTRDPGRAFPEKLRDALDGSDAVFVVIGKEWLDRLTEREGNYNDWVRMEVSQGLARPGLRVVPVCCMGVELPSAAKLPEDIRDLVYRDSVSIDPFQDFELQVDRLLSDLERSDKSGVKGSKIGNVVGRSTETPREARPRRNSIEGNFDSALRERSSLGQYINVRKRGLRIIISSLLGGLVSAGGFNIFMTLAKSNELFGYLAPLPLGVVAHCSAQYLVPNGGLRFKAIYRLLVFCVVACLGYEAAIYAHIEVGEGTSWAYFIAGAVGGGAFLLPLIGLTVLRFPVYRAVLLLPMIGGFSGLLMMLFSLGAGILLWQILLLGGLGCLLPFENGYPRDSKKSP